jgi:hypothetical protein
MGQIFSSGGRSTRRPQQTTERPRPSRPWITFRRFVNRTARRIRCFVKSNTEPALAWFQEQLDNIASWTEPLVSGLRTISRGTLHVLTLVTRPLITAICWVARACIAVVCSVVKACIAIVKFILGVLLIVAVIWLIVILPVPVLIVIFWLCILYTIVVLLSVYLFRAIRYLASHAFDCLNGINDRVTWWLTFIGRLGCIAAILSCFFGPGLLCIPAVGLVMVIIYAVSPLVTWTLDPNIFLIRNYNHILIQLLKAIKETYKRLGTGFRAFFRGFVPSRLAPVISLFIAGSLLGPSAITIPQVVSVVLGIIFALRRDPVIGPHMDEFFTEVVEIVNPILEWLLRCFGLDRNQVNEWLDFFHSSLMRIFSTAIIAIPLGRLAEQTLQRLPGGWASGFVIVVGIVSALIMIFIRRRQFVHGGWVRDEEASQPFDRTRGAPVYSSQRATFGSINHQILIVDHQDVGPYKYELTIPRNDGQARAEYSCSPVPAQQARRTVPLTDSGDNFYVYLIGWTTLSHTEIHAFCNTLMPWTYSSTRHNCQHFIRRVAEHIVATQATDWGFFYRGEETPYQAWLIGQWRVTWPIWLLDGIFACWMPFYLFVREALY